MRKPDSKSEAVRVLKGWLESVSHGELTPVDGEGPSPAAGRIERVFETLKEGIRDGRIYLTSCDTGVRSPLGPMMVLLDADGALIAGVAGPPERAEDDSFPPELRRRFTWP